MTLLRSYFLPDTGEQLSCYIAPNGIVKLKVAGKGYDLIVGIGRNEPEIIETDQGTLNVHFSDTASHFCDAVYQEHIKGKTAFNTVLALMGQGKLSKPLADFTDGWVLPV